eukprot:4055475-Lingulodinium_polyedra.AAC.1
MEKVGEPRVVCRRNRREQTPPENSETERPYGGRLPSCEPDEVNMILMWLSTCPVQTRGVHR